jgi:hypothetical protein
MAKKTRKKSRPAKKKARTKKSRPAPKKKAAKRATKRKAKSVTKRAAEPHTIGERLSSGYHTVVDTVTGTDRLRNTLEQPGTSESE